MSKLDPAVLVRCAARQARSKSPVEAGDRRLHVRVPARSCQPPRLQDRVVVLHRQRQGRRRPALRLPGHVLSRRHRSHAGQSVEVGGARSLHDTPGDQRCEGPALSLCGKAVARRARARRSEQRSLSRLERRLDARWDRSGSGIRDQGVRDRGAGNTCCAPAARRPASISCSTKASRRRSMASTASARRARSRATPRTTTR